MSRKKHAWSAYRETASTPDMNPDILWMAERAVESAVLEDFTDALFDNIAQLQHITEETQSRHVRLGIELALREITRTLDEKTS